jgi:malate synthase
MTALSLARQEAPMPVPPDASSVVLTPDAVRFVEHLVRTFGPRRDELLRARAERQGRIDRGEETLSFLPETAEIRRLEWKVAPIPLDLVDRRVEITGPVERKMIINALNSGANVFMADFEDSLSPTWANVIAGQQNLMDAVRRTITYEDPRTGKRYALRDETAVLVVRPRGLHLDEANVVVDGAPAPASLVDFGLYFFHNARALLDHGTGPYFYLAKLQSHKEAKWWADVFAEAEDLILRLPRRATKATVLIETLPAAFQMDEILHELKDYCVGLNCGRWDYIFSTIKTRRDDATAVMPDRAAIAMTQPSLRAYAQLLIKTCHRRGAFAMGGMAAQIPVKGDDAKNEAALAKVRADKAREAAEGHDGTWVAHPALVPIAKEIFDDVLQGKRNQLDVARDDVDVDAQALLDVPRGARTEDGLRHDVKVGVQYVEAWLSGLGCVPLYDLMEDAATAEISRALIWQWLRHAAPITWRDGSTAPLTVPRLLSIVDEELDVVREEVGAERFAAGRFGEAVDLFVELATAQDFVEFLTLPAYRLL